MQPSSGYGIVSADQNDRDQPALDGLQNITLRNIRFGEYSILFSV
jgi:hypothetical protein